MGGGQAGQAAIPLATSPGATPTPLSRTTTTIMALPLMSLLGRAATLVPTTHHAGLDGRLHNRMGSAALVVSTPLVDVPGMRQQVSKPACRDYAVAMLYAHLHCTFQAHMQRLAPFSLIIWQCHQSAITIVIMQQLLLGDNMLLDSCYTSLCHHHSTC